MRATLPTELLVRLMNASPEQFAAVERILGCNASKGDSSWKMEDGTEANELVREDVARGAFALLEKLDADAPMKAPSVLTVFRLYCVDGYSANQVARKCRCAKGTVMSRLRFIETVTKTRPEDFRAMSGHLQRVDDEIRASGAREIYRRGLVVEE
jgi:hypothetical protein